MKTATAERTAAAGFSAVLGVLAMLFAPPSIAQAQEPVVAPPVRMINAVVASIDGKAITLREFRAYGKGRGLLLPPDQRRTEASLLDGMIEERLLQAECEAQQIHADDEDTQYYIDRILAMNQSSRAEVERALAEIGLEWPDYFERMRFEVEKLALTNREIRARVHVTDEEVERYWRESGGALEAEGFEVSQIFIPLPPDGNPDAVSAAVARAKEAHAAIDADGFERTAKKYSYGPTASEGGSLGKFEQGQLAPEFEERLALMAPGDHTEVFEARGGLHILRLDRVVAGGDRKELTDERREQLRDKLYDDLLDERLRRWVNEDLHKKHHVSVRLASLGRVAGLSGIATR